jgi:hypothetical protein
MPPDVAKRNDRTVRFDGCRRSSYYPAFLGKGEGPQVSNRVDFAEDADGTVYAVSRRPEGLAVVTLTDGRRPPRPITSLRPA